MSKTHQQQSADFLDMWIGEGPIDARWSDAEEVTQLFIEHNIPEEFRTAVQSVLNFAAKAYWKDTSRANIDYKTCRKDLEKLISATDKLLSVFDDAAADTFRVFHAAGVAREFRNHPMKEIVETSLETVLSDTREPVTQGPKSFDDFRTQLRDLRTGAQFALKWSGAGKPGRPEDDSAIGLMQACFLIWTEMANRDFSLAWHGNDADSDAARFCIDVARLIDPNLSISRIIHASRKVREKGIGINNLDKLIEKEEEFRKRID